MENCEEIKDGICIKCKETNKWIGFFSYNIFECIKTNLKNCLRCDDILGLTSCTECNDGFIKTTYGQCQKNSEI